MSKKHSVDFLTAKSHFAKKRHPAARVARAVFMTLAGPLILVFLVGLPFWYSGARMVAEAARGKALLEDASVSAEAYDFASAADEAGAARDAFVTARERLDALVPLSFVPKLGLNLAAADDLFASGIAATDAARTVFAIGSDILAAVDETSGVRGPNVPLPDPATLFKDLSTDQKRRILAAFAESAGRIKDASLRINEAVEAIDRIPKEGVAAPFAATVIPLRAKLVTARAALGAVAPFADVLPAVLGYPDEKNYLFFFQNNDELRPSGGFLGVFGALKVKDAGIADLRTDDVYALDGPSERLPRPLPPEPIRKYIGVQKWYLRDANWSPDFPTAAATMEQFYREEAAVASDVKTIPEIDGVAAITPDFAEDVVRLTGPVTVEGKTFDADNLIEKLQYEVEQGFAQEGIPFHERKNIVGGLVTAVAAKLIALPLSRLIDVLEIVDTNLREGHIVLYANDKKLQAAIDERDWGGRMKQITGDYVTYIDANLAALKTDSVMERSLKYTIVPSGAGYEGRVAMTYKNNGTFTWKTTRYRTYARIFVPQGTTLLGVDGAMENDKIKDPARRPGKPDGYDQLGRKAYGAFISIEPGETRTMTFRIGLAPQTVMAIKNGTYHLDFEKQLGTEAVPLTLDFDFGKKLSDAVPAEARKDWGDARYKQATDLRLDRAFDIRF